MSPATQVGWGFDAHRLDGDPPLRLGGVIVSDTDGVTATSDGDVLAHAITDALLGACVLGDMGTHFPSNDPSFLGADSMELLRSVVGMAAEAGWRVAHVDATVVAQSIMVTPHREPITANIAEALRLAASAVSMKATSTDGLGFIGRAEGIAAVAVVSVAKLHA